MAVYDKIVKYKLEMELTGPMHIGAADGENGEILINSEGKPFIQASGIAGIFRAYIEEKDKHLAEEMFGSRNMEATDSSSDSGSKVVFTDGLFTSDDGKKPLVELRPRVRLDENTGVVSLQGSKGSSSESGGKFQMEYIGAGANLETYIYVFENSEDRYEESVKNVISALNNGSVQLGGNKSNGCGYVSVKDLSQKIFDMHDEKDRLNWRDEEKLSPAAYTPVSLDRSESGNVAYTVTVEGKTEGTVLVKSNTKYVFKDHSMAEQNMQNAKGDYIIPGSSFKGTIKNQMRRIAGYMSSVGNFNVDDVIGDTFGIPSVAGKSGKVGNIAFSDTVVGNRGDNDSLSASCRIHIDKFTGGEMNGALFRTKNAYGKVTFEISIANKNNPERSLGLLILALRDLADGNVTVGGSANVGCGVIETKTIKISDKMNGSTAVISFPENFPAGEDKTKISDDSGIIDNALKSLKEKAV